MIFEAENLNTIQQSNKAFAQDLVRSASVGVFDCVLQVFFFSLSLSPLPFLSACAFGGNAKFLERMVVCGGGCVHSFAEPQTCQPFKAVG